MRSKLALSFFALSGLALLPAAGFASRATQDRDDDRSKVREMTGCLQKGTEPNTYTLSDVEGKGPKTVGIVSSTPNLAPHVGHKIEVTGTAVPVSEAEADSKLPKAPHYMKLTAIKMISTTCP